MLQSGNLREDEAGVNEGIGINRERKEMGRKRRKRRVLNVSYFHRLVCVSV